MKSQNDYRIRFFDAEGSPIGDRLAAADSVTAVIEAAKKIASEMNAVEFSVMLLPPKVRGG